MKSHAEAVSPFRPGSPELVGKTVALTTDGSILAPNLPQNVVENLISFRGPAAHYVVSTQGQVQQQGNVPGFSWPLACFKINWTIGGTNFQTTVDGNSDQFLGVVAERVTVDAVWDFENALTTFPGAAVNPLNFPKKVVMSASLAEGKGLASKAFRSRLIPSAGNLSIPIPYAAKGFIIRRSLQPAWLTGTAQFIAAGNSLVIDEYLPADIAAAHGRGEYLAIPSTADVMTYTGAGPALATPGQIEFLLQM